MPRSPAAGVSVVPAPDWDNPLNRDYRFWYHVGNRAIRAGDWKLVAAGKGPWELFNLKMDRSETKDLAAENPDKVKELDAAWTKHAEEFRELAKRDLPRAAKNARPE